MLPIMFMLSSMCYKFVAKKDNTVHKQYQLDYINFTTAPTSWKAL